MKIAIATLGRNVEAEISPQAGRAPYYLIFEGDELLEVWSNLFARGGGGAGFSVAKVMGDKGVGLLVARQLGDKMKNALSNYNIDFKETDERLIKDILTKL